MAAYVHEENEKNPHKSLMTMGLAPLIQQHLKIVDTKHISSAENHITVKVPQKENQ